MALLRSSLLARVILSMLVALLFGWAASEISFRLQGDGLDRAPRRIELVIPPGTADRVAAGENVISLPDNQIYISGDVLVVRNEDSVSHHLGPTWVLPGGSATLNLIDPNQYTYACSFRPGNALGLDVRPRLTTSIRLQGILSIGLPTGVLLALYMVAAVPLTREEKDGGRDA